MAATMARRGSAGRQRLLVLVLVCATLVCTAWAGPSALHSVTQWSTASREGCASHDHTRTDVQYMHKQVSSHDVTRAVATRAGAAATGLELVFVHTAISAMQAGVPVAWPTEREALLACATHRVMQQPFVEDGDGVLQHGVNVAREIADLLPRHSGGACAPVWHCSADLRCAAVSPAGDHDVPITYAHALSRVRNPGSCGALVLVLDVAEAPDSEARQREVLATATKAGQPFHTTAVSVAFQQPGGLAFGFAPRTLSDDGSGLGTTATAIEYVRMTPGIATGLLISAFLIGTLLVALSCLFDVKTPSTFVATPLPPGKEF